MATSRDDFVIAIRSAFLKKGNKQRWPIIKNTWLLERGTYLKNIKMKLEKNDK